MPIYAYRCTRCGFEKDIMQKISDLPLTTCPGCQSETFAKQLTAPGFQLKGSGWYATDFRGGGAGKSSVAGETTGETTTAPATATSSASEATGAKA